MEGFLIIFKLAACQADQNGWKTDNTGEEGKMIRRMIETARIAFVTV